MKINMKTPTGIIKQVKLGFSWTMLFLGVFVPLFRGDFKWAIITFLASLVTCGIAWFVFPFIYNKIYIKEMIEKGWLPADEIAADALKNKGIFVPNV